MRSLFAASLCVLLLSVISPARVRAQTVTAPAINIVNNDIFVSFSVMIEQKNVNEIRQGVDKELRIYVDLFRVWNIWPDEFVTGKSYMRAFKVDPIKKEYIATSNDGSVIVEKRFRSFESMLDWTLTVAELKLTNTRELDPANYFVKVTVESKIRKKPPLIGYLLIFLPENEFKITKKSTIFTIEGTK